MFNVAVNNKSWQLRDHTKCKRIILSLFNNYNNGINIKTRVLCLSVSLLSSCTLPSSSSSCGRFLERTHAHHHLRSLYEPHEHRPRQFERDETENARFRETKRHSRDNSLFQRQDEPRPAGHRHKVLFSPDGRYYPLGDVFGLEEPYVLRFAPAEHVGVDQAGTHDGHFYPSVPVDLFIFKFRVVRIVTAGSLVSDMIGILKEA